MPRLRRRRVPSPMLRLPAVVVAASALWGCASAGGGGGGTSAPKEAASASLCDVPPLDSTAFHRVERGGYSVGVPKGYVLSSRADVDWTEFRSGVRRVVLMQGNYPTLFADGETQTVLRSTCTAVIGGRPVEIVSISYDVATRELEAPDAATGMHFVVGARWSQAVGGRDVAMWIDTKDPAASKRLRGMFWTVRFKGDSTASGGGAN